MGDKLVTVERLGRFKEHLGGTGSGNLSRRLLQEGEDKDYTWGFEALPCEVDIPESHLGISIYHSFYLGTEEYTATLWGYLYQYGYSYNHGCSDECLFEHIDVAGVKMSGSSDYLNEAVLENSSLTGDTESGLHLSATFLADDGARQARFSFEVDIDLTQGVMVNLTVTPLYSNGELLYPCLYGLEIPVTAHTEQRYQPTLAVELKQPFGPLDDLAASGRFALAALNDPNSWSNPDIRFQVKAARREPMVTLEFEVYGNVERIQAPLLLENDKIMVWVMQIFDALAGGSGGSSNPSFGFSGEVLEEILQVLDLLAQVCEISYVLKHEVMTS